MRWITGQEQEIIQHGDMAFVGPHAGIACLDDRRFIIASGRPVHLSYVEDGAVKNTHILFSISHHGIGAYCAGIQLSDDWSEVYVLMHNKWGRVLIERVAFNCTTGEFTWRPSCPIHIPSAHKPLRDHIEIEWPREAATIAHLLVPDRFKTAGMVIDKYENIPIGPSYYKYPPVFARVGTKLVIGINHLQPIGVFHTHQWDFTPREEFMTTWIDKIATANELLVGQWLNWQKEIFVHVTTETVDKESDPPTKSHRQQWIEDYDAPMSYLEGEWWRYDRRWEWQQHWGWCKDLYQGVMVCLVCGCVQPCECTEQKHYMPAYKFEKWCEDCPCFDCENCCKHCPEYDDTIPPLDPDEEPILCGCCCRCDEHDDKDVHFCVCCNSQDKPCCTHAHENEEGEVECTHCEECDCCKCCRRCKCCRCKKGEWVAQGDYHEIDRVWCRTLLQHPVLISSIVVLDVNTGEVDGVTHVASSHIGRSTKYDPNFIINGMLSVGNEIDVTFSKMRKDIPLSPLLWGKVPLGRDAESNSARAEWPLFRFLQWYGSSHLPWLLQDDVAMLDGEDYQTRRLIETYTITGLSNGATFLDPAVVKINPSTMRIPYQPFTAAEYSLALSMSETHGIGRTVSTNRNWKYEVTSHEYVSRFQGNEIGRGQDIVVGMVVAYVPKTVQVTITNNDRMRMTLENVLITVHPDWDFPYYQFVSLWDNPVSIPSLAFGASVTFNVTVTCPASQEHPKPVLLRTTYTKSF